MFNNRNGILSHSLATLEGVWEFVVFFIEPSFALGATVTLFFSLLVGRHKAKPRACNKVENRGNKVKNSDSKLCS